MILLAKNGSDEMAKTYVWTQARMIAILFCLVVTVGTLQIVQNNAILVGETRINEGKHKIGMYVGGI